MIAVELDGGSRGVAPLPRPGLALLLVRHRGDQAGQPGHVCCQQGTRIGVALQHGQVSLAQVTGQRGHRHQLPDQVLDPHLMLASRLRQPVTRPHPPVQRRGVRARQLEQLQTPRVGDRHPGQRLRVDPVRLRVPAQELAQVRGLRRGHPVHVVTTAGEEHRDRHPRRPGRLKHHRQPRARRRAGQRRPLHRGQGPPPSARTRPGTPPGHRALAPAPRAARRSPGQSRPAALSLAARPLAPSAPHRASSPDSSAPAARQAATPSATVPGRRSPATAPIHVLQPDQALSTGLAHFPDAGHPWPGQQWQSNPRGPAPAVLRT